MQKLALIDGISYSVDMTKPVGKGVRGTIVYNRARTASARSRSIAPSAGAATAATCAKPHASKSTARIRNSYALHHRTPQHDAQR